jgi:Ca2+-binding EF-hand superfamily protein
LFNYYDRSGDGRIDYKEFTNILVDGGKSQEVLMQEQAMQSMRPAVKTTSSSDVDVLKPE